MGFFQADLWSAIMLRVPQTRHGSVSKNSRMVDCVLSVSSLATRGFWKILYYALRITQECRLSRDRQPSLFSLNCWKYIIILKPVLALYDSATSILSGCGVRYVYAFCFQIVNKKNLPIKAADRFTFYRSSALMVTFPILVEYQETIIALKIPAIYPLIKGSQRPSKQHIIKIIRYQYIKAIIRLICSGYFLYHINNSAKLDSNTILF